LVPAWTRTPAAGELSWVTAKVVDVLFELETVNVPPVTVVGSATPICWTSASGAKNSKKPMFTVVPSVSKCGAATVKLTFPVAASKLGKVSDWAFVENHVPRIASRTDCVAALMSLRKPSTTLPKSFVAVTGLMSLPQLTTLHPPAFHDDAEGFISIVIVLSTLSIDSDKDETTPVVPNTTGSNVPTSSAMWMASPVPIAPVRSMPPDFVSEI
jgi:hypothetical protein